MSDSPYCVKKKGGREKERKRKDRRYACNVSNGEEQTGEFLELVGQPV